MCIGSLPFYCFAKEGLPQQHFDFSKIRSFLLVSITVRLLLSGLERPPCSSTGDLRMSEGFSLCSTLWIWNGKTNQETLFPSIINRSHESLRPQCSLPGQSRLLTDLTTLAAEYSVFLLRNKWQTHAEDCSLGHYCRNHVCKWKQLQKKNIPWQRKNCAMFIS